MPGVKKTDEIMICALQTSLDKALNMELILFTFQGGSGGNEKGPLR